MGVVAYRSLSLKVIGSNPILIIAGTIEESFVGHNNREYGLDSS